MKKRSVYCILLGCVVAGGLVGCSTKGELPQAEEPKTKNSNNAILEAASEQIQFLYGTCELGDYSLCFYRNVLNELVIEASLGKESSQVAVYSAWKDYAYTELEESMRKGYFDTFLTIQEDLFVQESVLFELPVGSNASLYYILGTDDDGVVVMLNTVDRGLEVGDIDKDGEMELISVLEGFYYDWEGDEVELITLELPEDVSQLIWEEGESGLQACFCDGTQKSALVENGDLRIADTEDVTNQEISEKNTPISASQAFQSVLLNEKAFSCTDKRPYDWLKVVHDFDGYLKDIPYGYEGKKSIAQFAVVDMDGDTLPEVVLAIEEYYGYIILRYREGQIYGNVVGIREMGSLNTAGAFFSSSGAADGGIEKFYFVGDTIVSNEAVRMTDQDTYYIHDMISDKEAWDEMNDLFDESPKVEWYDFTEEQVRSEIVGNPLFTELSPEISENISGRQQYIDSLSYLLELTYDNSKKKNDVYREDAKAYLEGCVQEMEKIYQLCQENLSGEALENLQEEQQLWLENYKRRTNRELAVSQIGNMDELLESDIEYKYWTYGDLILRRTLALIDLYYDCQFYDSLF